MIPKQAFFTWVGDTPLPWLRQLSVDSFKKQNPEWDVEFLHVTEYDYLAPAQATDIYRYGHLAAHGGLYFDTDILFLKPVPDELLDADVSITIDRSAFQDSPNDHPVVEGYPGFNNLALLGCVPDCRLFWHAHETAHKRLAWLREDGVDIKHLMYQVFGTEMLNREFCGKTQDDIGAMFGISIYNIPLDVVLPIRWNENYKLFNGTPLEVGPETIGVHWYGGSYDAKRYQHQFNLDNYKRRPCYLSDVITEVTK